MNERQRKALELIGGHSLVEFVSEASSAKRNDELSRKLLPAYVLDSSGARLEPGDTVAIYSYYDVDGYPETYPWGKRTVGVVDRIINERAVWVKGAWSGNTWGSRLNPANLLLVEKKPVAPLYYWLCHTCGGKNELSRGKCSGCGDFREGDS